MAELLSFKGGVLELDLSLSEFVQRKHQAPVDAVVQELLNTQTYCRSNSELRAIGTGASVAALADGTGYACRDEVRLELWCKQDVTFISHILVD
jgi:hypothetical protein